MTIEETIKNTAEIIINMKKKQAGTIGFYLNENREHITPFQASINLVYDVMFNGTMYFDPNYLKYIKEDEWKRDDFWSSVKSYIEHNYK